MTALFFFWNLPSCRGHVYYSHAGMNSRRRKRNNAHFVGGVRRVAGGRRSFGLGNGIIENFFALIKIPPVYCYFFIIKLCTVKDIRQIDNNCLIFAVYRIFSYRSRVEACLSEKSKFRNGDFHFKHSTASLCQKVNGKMVQIIAFLKTLC